MNTMDKLIHKRLLDGSDDKELRRRLIKTARTNDELLTYGQVVKRMYCECWSIRMLQPLCTALDRIGKENQKNGEPLLPALVVADKNKLPGRGFFRKFCSETLDDEKQASCHEECVAEIRKFDWPD